MKWIARAVVNAPLLLSSHIVLANIVTTPLGLHPGDTYQLAFVTADVLNPTSTNIADYNNFVTDEAALNPVLAAFDAAHSVTWAVIGSTASIDARDNAPAFGSVYTLNGVLIADAAQPLYSALPFCIPANCDLLAPLDINQFGNNVLNLVWTGTTNPNGTANFQVFGASSVVAGGSDLTDSGWISDGAAAPTAFGAPVYALSSRIMISTPEPSVLPLLLGAYLAFFLMRVRRSGTT